MGLAGGWAGGQRPDVAVAKKWTPEDWQIFLQALPRQLSEADCQWLDDNFQLTQHGNCEILCNWLAIAANSGYAPTRDRTAKFLGEVGRMKYLKPLYTALHKNAATTALAKETFAKAGGGYHPIARGGIERILSS
jgi:hypothetical protein